MRKLNVIELFAGAGGLLDGFEQTKKYNLIAAVEWLKPQVRTLKNRLKSKYNMGCLVDDIILNFDIQRSEELFNGWEDSDYLPSVGLNQLVGNKCIDVISGGPPCQAYSIAGRIRDKDGMKNDYRNFLFEAYIRVVKEYRPKIIVFENVEGILSAIPTGERITDLIRTAFAEIGYEIIDDLRKDALLDLAEFGVPQVRKRVIIVGVRKDKNINYQNILENFYRCTLMKYKVNYRRTVKDAIGDLPPIYPVKQVTKRVAYDNLSQINGHKSRYHNLRDQEIFGILAKDIEDNVNEFNSTDKLIKLYQEKTGKITNVHKYHVLRWDKPSNTIPAHLKKDGLRHIHPDSRQKRSITVREAARLQTFDDDFEFIESQVANYEMIGNAVPPLFAKKLALSILELYKSLVASEK
ncbi:DNA cytosine methyltransferase [Veillonella sp. AS16]|uniref:DNA cytosine methyltransferase n=1 Tax=Veillonella sp. AS16 TaxID=936589 RepID=UPI0003E29617|nr:DNA (cytosine-5-)-methyltransferase [Veillonella sp. AS16]ETS92726.1 DNA (cytosine-5-)-methyltransferase [Veillonella sp. AS16]